jgi:hypothetical protein
MMLLEDILSKQHLAYLKNIKIQEELLVAETEAVAEGIYMNIYVYIDTYLDM